MSTTCQDIVSRAQSFNTLNQGLTSDSVEMLSRIRSDQQSLFTSVAGLTRDYFQSTVSITSTGGASGRTFDLSAVSPPVERVLMVTLGDGRQLNEVDIQDIDAELAPRYVPRGTKLVEVSNDWGSSGTKTATMVYVYGMTDVDPSGSLTQNVTVPDPWVDLLVLPLARYLASKDPGRDPNEIQNLSAMLDEKQQEFVAYLTNYSGIKSTRLVIPAPISGGANKK